jgi:hypothetical protein
MHYNYEKVFKIAGKQCMIAVSCMLMMVIAVGTKKVPLFSGTALIKYH